MASRMQLGLPLVLAWALGMVMASDQSDGPWVAVCSVIVAIVGLLLEARRSGRDHDHVLNAQRDYKDEVARLRDEVARCMDGLHGLELALVELRSTMGQADNDE